MTARVTAHVLSDEAVCPICGREAARLLVARYSAANHEYRLFECQTCTVRFWTPRTGAGAHYYASEQLSMYQAIHDGERPVEKDARYRAFFRGFDATRPQRVLDIGCGSGDLLQEVQRLGHEVWGVDFDPISIERARARGLKNVCCGSVEGFFQSHPELTFDQITAFDVVEHLTDPIAVLRRVRDALKPGGALTVTVPNRERLLADKMLSDFPPHHFFRFDRHALRYTLEEAGFTSVSSEQLQFGYALPAALDVVIKGARRWRGSLGGASTGGDSTARLTSDGPKHAPHQAAHVRVRAHGLLKRAALKAVGLSGVLSGVVEAPLGRGFKLMARGYR